jgi:hypothetical protein
MQHAWAVYIPSGRCFIQQKDIKRSSDILSEINFCRLWLAVIGCDLLWLAVIGWVASVGGVGGVGGVGDVAGVAEVASSIHINSTVLFFLLVFTFSSFHLFLLHPSSYHIWMFEYLNMSYLNVWIFEYVIFHISYLISNISDFRFHISYLIFHVFNKWSMHEQYTFRQEDVS